MRICCISDQHGELPVIEECDILCIAGDICPVRDHSLFAQMKFLSTQFKNWLESVPAKEVVACWGNHDFIGQNHSILVPKLRWHLLTDQIATVSGLKFFGSPYQPWFYDWAFNAPPNEGKNEGEEFLDHKFSAIPDDTDIIIVHGPPKSYGDMTHDGVSTGSESLLKHILRVKPKLSVHGHIHSGRGVWRFPRGNKEDGIICNASVLNEAYKMVYLPMYFDIA